jgi:hypothetical protein
MIQPQSSIHPTIQKRFSKNFRWTLAGSITYEVLKAVHCFFLLQMLPPHLYGSMGSLFSIIYLATYIADLGATNSIPPFLHIFIRNKVTFKRFLLFYSFLPSLPFIVFCAIGTTVYVYSNFSYLPYLIIIVSLVILETIRSFFRLLLYTTFHAKRVVITEVVLFIIYIANVWVPYLLFHHPITLNHIFIPHLIDSILAVSIFLILIKSFYKTLPVDSTNHLPHSLTKRLISTRLFNYLLRVSRSLFTPNFLTPLFALKFGLASAGLFYFGSTIISALQSIIKAAIGYSGNALLANVKDNTQGVKKEAFSVLCQKLIILILPLIILLSVNYKAIVRLSLIPAAPNYTLALSLLYLFITCTEFFFMLYEQFYIIEEAAHKLFFFKLIELAIFYGFIKSAIVSSPIATLLGIISIRLISFSIIATNAFYLWKIKPDIKANIRYVSVWIIVSLVFSLVLTLWW